ncbi:MAG: polysulfide reductase NrfD [Anaerolineae bacterium]|nr:polysulfide reductase NrfD [Anaerolineae bacterium]MCB0224556.1 polysulfide reductase NrfD [Anaerolineae bacterium]
MNYGFIINNKTCIGCHACSTACKSENEVPLGVYRTWVKYVEKGEFPNSKRYFQVTRCNHCANPPCVRICPVTAMYQRHDGIVEFDPDVCIGCKACMQACPYDAIYIDPNTHSAAKCHYCSHRTDLGLEPACVVVCPTHSIIAGDLDDPHSEISRRLTREQVSVRKPEQGTAPKLFYIEGDDIGLTPTATKANFMWSDLISEQAVGFTNGHRNGNHQALEIIPLQAATKTATSGTPIRTPTAQGVGSASQGPIHIGEGRLAEHMVQTTYNAQHKVPWHWPVPAYLVTKGIGSGVFSLLAIFFGLNLIEFDPLLALAGNFVALAFIGLTTLLLVIDLEKPQTFLRIVFRPQLKSWLARGAFILMGFSTVGGLWLLLEGAAYLGFIDSGLAAAVRIPLLVIGFVLAMGSAVYTAFLFGQAEGRDLWQSSLLPAHLVIQALMVGSGVLLAVGLFVPLGATLFTALLWIFGVALVVDLFVTLLGEFGMPHASEVAARAAHDISHGKYKNHFWAGAIGLGHILPLLLVIAAAFSAGAAPLLVAAAAVLTVIGLYLFEYAFVMAPQEVPNS